MDLDDTIVAVASAAGGAVRGVVRVSGPDALRVVGELSAQPLAGGWRGAVALGAQLRLDEYRILPTRLFVWPGVRSFTRQPTVEIHTIGSPPLLEFLVRRACEFGARLARPGEFTLRAFLAGRLDLTQAEAVLGVIDAESDRALNVALGQLAGGIATPIAALREELLLLLADLEAGLDFADEDIEFISSEVLASRLQAVSHHLADIVLQVEQRQVGTELPRVVLAGPVNAGKSSLFNAIVRRFGDKHGAIEAIESPEPGATRDYLQAAVRLGGTRCLVVDTAGLESLRGSDSPAARAQTMRQTVGDWADLVIRCREVGGPPAPRSSAKPELAITTKADLEANDDPSDPTSTALRVSAATGQGLDRLAAAVADRMNIGGEQLVPSTAQRSLGSLRAAQTAVQASMQLAGGQASEELVATELRVALSELGQVAGVVYTDDVLDRVFSRFCIGK